MSEETQTTEAQPEAITDAAPATEVMSNDEIAALAKGASTPAPEVATQPEGEEEGAESDETPEKPQPEGEDEPKPAKDKSKIRVPLEVAEKHKQEARDAKAALIEERRKGEALVELLKKLTGEGDKAAEAEDEDDDIVDTALDKKLTSKIEKLEHQMETKAFTEALHAADAIGRKQDAAYEDATDFVYFATASRIIAEATAVGEEISVEDAVLEAKKSLAPVLYRIYQKSNGNPAALSTYVLTQARALGFTAKSKTAEAGRGASKVNMEAVNRAREQAGAPVVKRESVVAAGSNWEDDIAARARAKYDPEYLRRMGIG